MSTIGDIFNAVSYRIYRDGSTTIGASSEPTETEAIKWINEDIKTIAGICAQEKSELGRTLATITTRIPSVSAITQASPGQVTTSSAHGLATGDEVLIKNVEGMTDVNDTIFTATLIDSTNFTIGTDTSGYDAWSSGGTVYPLNYSDINDLLGISEKGWIQKTNSRDELELTDREDEINYSPSTVSEPSKYFIDENIDIRFLETADAAYTVRIPYWPFPTAITATTDTTPFKGVFDNLLTESLTIRIQNRDEFELGHELKWYQFMMNEARSLIRIRKNPASGVGL